LYALQIKQKVQDNNQGRDDRAVIGRREPQIRIPVPLHGDVRVFTLRFQPKPGFALPIRADAEVRNEFAPSFLLYGILGAATGGILRHAIEPDCS
jgi:hypothetical protein